MPRVGGLLDVLSRLIHGGRRREIFRGIIDEFGRRCRGRRRGRSCWAERKGSWLSAPSSVK